VSPPTCVTSVCLQADRKLHNDASRPEVGLRPRTEKPLGWAFARAVEVALHTPPSSFCFAMASSSLVTTTRLFAGRFVFNVTSTVCPAQSTTVPEVASPGAVTKASSGVAPR
jgi:hypothetical protein